MGGKEAIMNSTEKWFVAVFATVFLGIIGIIGTVSYFKNTHEVEMAKLGYVQVLVPGQSQPVWRKEECQRLQN